jgi:hypothetical protein
LVEDTTPPEMTVQLSPKTLWPPNHRMIDVQATITAWDTCGGTSVTLSDVSSNEADNASGGGDGNTVDDIQDAEPGTQVSWTEAPGAESYDVIRGNVAEIAETGVVIGLGTVECLKNDSLDASAVEDPEIPDAGEAFFYVVSYFDKASSSFGTATAPKPRAPGPGACD